MSNEALTAVAKSDIKPSGRKFVMMALADYADEEWSCFPSVAQLAQYTGQGEKTVRDHLDALEDAGFITRNRARRDDGTLGRYRFCIQRRNLPVAKIARGEKQPKPAADFAAHNPHRNHQSNSSLRDDERARKSFAELWSIFPRRPGQSRKTAFKAFLALSDRDQTVCVDGAKAFAGEFEAGRSARRESTEKALQFVPALVRWIEGESWRRDEPGPNASGIVVLRQSDPDYGLALSIVGQSRVGKTGNITIKAEDLDRARSAA